VGVYLYRRTHPQFDRNATIRWHRAFDFERASYTLIILSIATFGFKFLVPPLGFASAVLLGARAAIAAMQHQQYDPERDSESDIHYVQ
jgi:hypothetical protein